MDQIWIGMLATGGCTALGAVPALFFNNVSHRIKDILLAYTAGIMVAASTNSLIPSALEMSNLAVLSIGVITGTLLLMILEHFIPHMDLEHTSGRPMQRIERSTLLFVTAMALHNLPEGLSVGVSFASEDDQLGSLVSFAIGLQNIPEGALIAFFLISRSVSRWYAFIFSAITGLIELLSFLIGFYFSQSIAGIVPYGLAFAAGAMLFVVYKELIPESHGDGHARSATFSFIVGLLTMIILSNTLG
ncbi:ZIP family metal transporter [Marinicrinis lubricantis]|uniref:ZIP family metal transporter n=1 Tax=Marinicrinis lubricantis TaxID=2086470 RepID=A0ABW1IUG7_9BACL